MEFALDFFVARDSAADELSAGRFLDVDVVVGSEASWDVMRRDRGPARGFGGVGRQRNFVGGGAWFRIGSTPVPHISHSHT